MTRAKERLYLLHPKDETYRVAGIDDDGERRAESKVSPFLWEAEVPLSRHAAAAIKDPSNFTSPAVAKPDIANLYFEQNQVKIAYG